MTTLSFELPITEINYVDALAEVDRMMTEHWRNPNDDLALQIDQLAAAIQAYEDITYPFPEPTPAELLEHLLAERERSPMSYVATPRVKFSHGCKYLPNWQQTG